MIPFPWRLAIYASVAAAMLVAFESTHSEWVEVGTGAIIFFAVSGIYLRRARLARESGKSQNTDSEAPVSSREPLWARALWAVAALGVFSLPDLGWGGTKAFLALALITGWTRAWDLLNRVRPSRAHAARDADRQTGEDNYGYWHRIEFKQRRRP